MNFSASSLTLPLFLVVLIATGDHEGCLGFVSMPAMAGRRTTLHSPTTRSRIARSTSTRRKASNRRTLFDDRVDDLFARFDTDKNGAIDKEEFRAIAEKLQVDSSRREIISVATATFGGIFVATASNTIQFTQKTFRSQYLEQSAENAQNRLFPTAMLSGDADKAISKTLATRGFTPENTLLGHSVCSDEVNNRKEQLIPLMVNRWQEGFTLGGLGGLPFAGKSGFGAYLHHVPDSGKLLVVFAPHVGIDAEGRVGSLQRDGQAAVSGACGAAIGAYKALLNQKNAAPPPDPLLVLENVKAEDTDQEFDPQLKQIVQLLATRLDNIDASADSIAFVTYQMYGMIRELITACITQTTDVFDYATEVAVVGGIIINRRKGGDFFQPLSFETRRKGEMPINLFEDAFGQRPDLLPVLGTQDAITRASISTA